MILTVIPRREPKDFYEWQNAVVSEMGPRSPTTRHVLLTLGIHMDRFGKSCFPSYEKLSEESGLSLRSVIRHMNLAYDEGWFSRTVNRGQAKGWRRYEYEASIPLGGDTDAQPIKRIAVTESPNRSDTNAH